MARLDEHAETIKAALPDLARKPSEYVTGGRYFQSIEIPEGARLTNAVIDLIGDRVLMFASDYPHGESHFPESVSLVLDWEMASAEAQAVLGQRSPLLCARSSRLKPGDHGEERDGESFHYRIVGRPWTDGGQTPYRAGP